MNYKIIHNPVSELAGIQAKDLKTGEPAIVLSSQFVPNDIGLGIPVIKGAMELIILEKQAVVPFHLLDKVIVRRLLPGEKVTFEGV